MNNGDINNGDVGDILKRAAGPDVDPALVDRIASSIGQSLQPVRPVPPFWVLSAGLVLACWVVAVGGGMILGLHGIRKMDAPEIALIFSALAVLVLLAAAVSVSQVIPGSRRPMNPTVLMIAGGLGLAAAFVALFHDYSTGQFVSQGMKCLVAGLAHAIPASLAAWWLLSRGIALNPPAAGMAKGILAGLAGVCMLELHCPNFEAPHVMVWHIAVMPLSAGAGALAAWIGQARSR